MELRRAIHCKGWPEGDWRGSDAERLYGLLNDALRPPNPKRGNRAVPLLTRETAKEVAAFMPDFFAEGFWARWKQLLEKEALQWEIVTQVDGSSETWTADRSAQGNLPGSKSEPIISGSGLLIGLGRHVPHLSEANEHPPVTT